MSITSKVVSAAAVLIVILGCFIQVQALMSGNLLTLPALGFYCVLVYLFINRKPSKQAATGGKNWLFALFGTYGPFFLQPAPTSLPYLKEIGFVLLPIGIAVTFIAISCLGRGFGIIAANREVKTHGIYRFIRHPLYAGEGLWFLAVVLQNLNLYNTILFALQMGCQVMRMQTEERLLSEDERYGAYLQTVKYRLLPGIY